MSDYSDKQERDALEVFLGSGVVEADLAVHVNDLSIEQHPLGKSSPPDFCLSSGGRRVAVEAVVRSRCTPGTEPPGVLRGEGSTQRGAG